MNVSVTLGFAPAERAQIGQMFWDAFRTKLRFALGTKTKALQIIVPNLQVDFALCAHTDDGTLIGFAGLKDQAGGLMAAGQNDLERSFGWFGGLWRSKILDQFDHEVELGTLYLDGMFVAPDQRGQGIGSQLLRAVEDLAETLNHDRVSLRVVDTNTQAQALYQRHGFQVVGQTGTGIWRPLVGYKTAITMQKAVSQKYLSPGPTA